jgi:hypothetical protein
MNYPVCCANAEHFVSTNDGLRIACPICGERLRKLSPCHRTAAETRTRRTIDVLNKAKRCAQPGARPMITTYLLASPIELGGLATTISD